LSLFFDAPIDSIVDTPMRRHALQALTLVVLLLAIASCGSQEPSIHLTLGNPSQAKPDLGKADNYLIRKQGYALSYNSSKGIANWVSWQLNSSWLGGFERQNNFRPDPELSEQWYAVRPNDYNRTGYDRGHMTPSGDRTKDAESNSETFLMTNIIPQAPDNNRGTWRELEEYSRQLTKQGKELYIISGSSGQKKRIARNKIVVPERVWKVIVVLDRPGLGASGVTANTRAIAVDLPNENGIDPDWRKYKTSIRKLEAETGYDFLSNVPHDIQNAIESTVDGEELQSVEVKPDVDGRAIAAVVLCGGVLVTYQLIRFLKKKTPK
jgi:endonuclease G, mitochondrial